MQMMDCVEVIVEKESYAREGVHKGMPVMSPDVNEQIKAQFDALEKGKKAEDISDYMI